MGELIEIAVVGAHLSGLPLNHELTARGGVLRRAARTEPCYRFDALAGGPPRRPGLLLAPMPSRRLPRATPACSPRRTSPMRRRSAR